jgi:hypothetical protein
MDTRSAAPTAPIATSGANPPASLYLVAPFSMGYVDFFTFLIPLYGLSLGSTPSRSAVSSAPDRSSHCFCRSMSAS